MRGLARCRSRCRVRLECSDSRSTAAAMRRASSSRTPLDRGEPTTRNSPRVSVPVLSNTTASRSRASSRPRRSRTSKPVRAPRVVEMATTSGTASPSACGQAMTSTVTTRSTANAPSLRRRARRQRERRRADRDDGQDERGAVSQGLRTRAGRLRLFDQPHDAGERGSLAGARHLDAQRAGAVDGAGDDLRALDLCDGNRFARDHRLVDVALAALHDAVGRHARAPVARARGRLRAAPERHLFVGPPTMRCAVLGSRLASPRRAPHACEIDRISIQWPSSMMVTSVASSHHSGIAGIRRASPRG